MRNLYQINKTNIRMSFHKRAYDSASEIITCKWRNAKFFAAKHVLILFLWRTSFIKNFFNLFQIYCSFSPVTPLCHEG